MVIVTPSTRQGPTITQITAKPSHQRPGEQTRLEGQGKKLMEHSSGNCYAEITPQVILPNGLSSREPATVTEDPFLPPKRLQTLRCLNAPKRNHHKHGFLQGVQLLPAERHQPKSQRWFQRAELSSSRATADPPAPAQH